MKLKNLLLAAAAALFISTASQAQVSYGLKAGLNLNKSTYDEKPFVDYQKNLAGLFLTAYADVPLFNQFAVQPGISLQTKGDKYKFDGDGMNGKATWNVMTIEIPVNLTYSIAAGSVGQVVLGAGPYVGFSVSGKRKIEGTIAGFGAVGEYDMKFTGDDRDQNLVDAGANFSLAYKWNSGLLLQAEYGLGISDLDPAGRNNHIHNRTLRFGVGFQF